VADDDYCYLTTTGRRSGQPHRIEIWYAEADHAEGSRTLYLLAGAGMASDWVRNLMAAPDVTVEIGTETRRAHGRVLDQGGDEAARARSSVFAKYDPREARDLSSWRDTALPVAIDLGASVSADPARG